MAKQYYAATRIEYGKRIDSPDGDPTKRRSEDVVFEPGDLVEGLNKDEMRGLWEAGALEERDDSGRAEKSGDDESGDQSNTQQPAVVRQPATAGPNATTDTVIVPDGSKS